MTTSHESVAALTDEQAVRALTLIVAYLHRTPRDNERPQLESWLQELALDPVLADYPGAAALPTDADLARAALAVTAESATIEPAVVADAITLANNPDRSGLEVVGVLTMVAVILQTEAKVERDPDGKWHILLHKHPTRDSALGQLLSKMIAYFTSGR